MYLNEQLYCMLNGSMKRISSHLIITRLRVLDSFLHENFLKNNYVLHCVKLIMKQFNSLSSNLQNWRYWTLICLKNFLELFCPVWIPAQEAEARGLCLLYSCHIRQFIAMTFSFQSWEKLYSFNNSEKLMEVCMWYW